VCFPSLIEVAMRASMLHSVSRERAAHAEADLCFHPPIDRFRLMDFPHLDDIVATGYAHAAEILRAWPGTGAPVAVPAAPIADP
jgi:predicted acylesterase/phospholipase RssA